MVWRMRIFGSKDGGYFSCLVKNYLDTTMEESGASHITGLKGSSFTMIILVALVLHWYLSLFFQTIFLHRYASHNMFKMKPMVEKVFYLLTFLFQGSSFLHPAAYGVMHRRHHAHTDTPRDPHSPVHIKNII